MNKGQKQQLRAKKQQMRYSGTRGIDYDPLQLSEVKGLLGSATCSVFQKNSACIRGIALPFWTGVAKISTHRAPCLVAFVLQQVFDYVLVDWKSRLAAGATLEFGAAFGPSRLPNGVVFCLGCSEPCQSPPEWDQALNPVESLPAPDEQPAPTTQS